MINYQNIDTKKLSERFAKTNSAVINDFLVEPFAEKLVQQPVRRIQR